MLDTSKIYTSNNCGDFKVIEYNGCMSVLVEFINTGYVTTTRTDHIINGNVKDYLQPSVCGIGYIGVGDYKAKVNGKIGKAYNTWSSMLERCYCIKCQTKHPTYKGCTVTTEWHNFQVFAAWFDVNYIKGYRLDKDIKMKGNKVYSPEVCMFVSQAENTIEAHAKCYKFTSPSGKIIDIYNMSAFCRENNLNHRNMHLVNSEKRKSHKGWAKA